MADLLLQEIDPMILDRIARLAVARGWTQAGGRPHAEAAALAGLGTEWTALVELTGITHHQPLHLPCRPISLMTMGSAAIVPSARRMEPILSSVRPCQ